MASAKSGVSHVAGARAGQECAGPREHGEGGTLRSSTAKIYASCDNGAGRVNLVRETKTGFVFLLGNEEKEVFLQILERYPRVPESHLRVSRSRELPKSEEIQRMLNEALAEQRT